MNLKKKTPLHILVLFAFLLGACKTNVARNDDGSLDVETSITQQELQEAVSAAIADPLIQDLTVSLQSGYALVSGSRARLNDPSKLDTLSFRLDLGVSNGQLTSSISDAQLDGLPLDQSRVDHWNETISNRLSRVGNRNPDSTLKSVTITPELVKMTWTVTR